MTKQWLLCAGMLAAAATAPAQIVNPGGSGAPPTTDASALTTGTLAPARLPNAVIQYTGQASYGAAYTVPDNTTVKFANGSIPLISATITLGNNSVLDCDPAGDAPGFARGSTILRQANGANLANMIVLTGQNSTIHNCSIDGNAANNTGTATPGLVSVQSVRSSIDHVSISNINGVGLKIGDSGTSQVAAASKLERVIINGASGNGLACFNTTDLFLSETEIENNGASGISLTGCPAMRFDHGDISGNVTGILADSASSQGMVTGGTRFGQNTGIDIDLAGATNWIVEGNNFAGSTTRADNAFPALRSTGGGLSVFSNNQFMSTASHRYSYAIFTANGSGTELTDVAMGNIVSGTQGAGCVNGTSTLFSAASCFNNVGVVTLPNFYVLPNGQTLKGFDSGNAIRDLLQMGSDNVLRFFGQPTTATIDFQAVPGTDSLIIGNGYTNTPGTALANVFQAPQVTATSYSKAPVVDVTEGAAIASAATIAPTTSLFHITGTTAISTMTPPAGMTASVGTGGVGGCLNFVTDAAVTVNAGTAVGSFKNGFTSTAGTMYQACLTPSTGLWYAK